jgi:Uma2 family endonuclease
MSRLTPTVTLVEYPDSDGQPMSDNTRQFHYIVMIQGGLDDLFRDRPDVFVAGNNLWYPVEGHPEIRTGPDVYVAFGRPKGDRGSYKQWEEDGIPPQVVFEVLSPGNRAGEMTRKFRFYERYGVEEYYLYDPDSGELYGWRRHGDSLDEVPSMAGLISPRLGIRFELVDGELQLFRPDGQRFLTYLQFAAQRQEERQRADQERQQKEKFAAKLRELGIDPDHL